MIRAPAENLEKPRAPPASRTTPGRPHRRPEASPLVGVAVAAGQIELVTVVRRVITGGRHAADVPGR